MKKNLIEETLHPSRWTAKYITYLAEWMQQRQVPGTHDYLVKREIIQALRAYAHIIAEMEK